MEVYYILLLVRSWDMNDFVVFRGNSSLSLAMRLGLAQIIGLALSAYKTVHHQIHSRLEVE